MGGTCQRHYVHGVPRQPGRAGERISLTFRTLLRPPDIAAAPRGEARVAGEPRGSGPIGRAAE
jgi:hypothetical protein